MEERKIGFIAAGNAAHAMLLNESVSADTESVEAEALPEIGSAEEGLPLRLSIERDSPYYCAAAAVVGVTLNGVEYPGIVEYSVNMGFVRIAKPDADGRVSAYAAKNAERRPGRVCVFWRGSPSRQVRRQLARVPAPR